MRASAGQRYPLSSGHSLIKPEEGYLRVSEQGDPASAEEMTRYYEAIDRALGVGGYRALLIQAQRQAPDAASPKWVPIRAARWQALSNSRAERIAVLVEDDLAVARVQMTALSMKAPVRAFRDETDALHWLRPAMRLGER